MEDQQPAAGDLTVDAAVGAAEDHDESANAPTESAEIASDEANEDADEEDKDADEDVDEDADEDDKDDDVDYVDKDDDADEAAATGTKRRRARRKWLAGKRLAIAVVLAALVFVLSAAFAGAAVQPYLKDRATAATKLKVARTAANAITTLWTYTPENMDGLADRAAAYLTGDFEAQYRKFVDAIVAANKQAKVTNTTEVTGAAVESLDDPNAVVIVYTNSTAKTPLKKNIPALKYLSFRLFMKRTNGQWLVTRMTTITSLDLTPQV